VVQLNSVYKQLKERRVIRSSVLYLALFWGLVEVADLLAGAEMISEDVVRWLLLGGVVGFPLTLVLSWFFESPWKKRSWFSVLGDVSVIIAIAVGAFLFARDQFLTSFTRPVVAIIRIEPTDTRSDTVDLATHLTKRFRMLLATRPEIRVIELASSQSPLLSDLPVIGKAAALGADFLIGGTVNQGNGELRLNIQLFSANGELLWSERFSDRLLDQAQLQNRVLSEMWPALPMSEKALEDIRELVVQCEYPASIEAIRVIAATEDGVRDELLSSLPTLSALIGENQDNGLLHYARAKAYFHALESAAPTSKPVLQNMAMKDLDQAVSYCSGHPGIAALRLYNTLQLQTENLSHTPYLSQFPNESSLRYKLATIYKNSGNMESARQFAFEAWSLNPLDPISLCFYQELLQSEEGKEKVEALQLLAQNTHVPGMKQTFDCK
jgi:TolB-like protein